MKIRYIFVLTTLIFCGCSPSCNRDASEDAPQNVLGIQSHKAPTYSSATILGTEWVADYISETPDRTFDKTKVGKEVDGDYIVSYYKDSRCTEVIAEEIYYASPTKLVLIKQNNDTIAYTIRN